MTERQYRLASWLQLAITEIPGGVLTAPIDLLPALLEDLEAINKSANKA